MPSTPTPSIGAHTHPNNQMISTPYKTQGHARRALTLLTVALLLALGACGDDDKKGDSANNAVNNDAPNNDAPNNDAPNNDPNNDAPESAYADALAAPVDDEFNLPGLKHPVHVTFDEFGIPHIVASSIEDAVMVQGYLHARDRMAQMELIRRSIQGKIARIAGALDPGTVDDDIFQRMIGFGRLGQAIYDSLPEGGLSRRTVDAYSAGVNVFIQQVRDGDVRLAPEVGLLVRVSALEDWTPADSLSIVRFQQYELSFDAFREMSITRSWLASRQTFSPESEDPNLAARAGIFQDLHRFAPADPFFITPGFAFDEAEGKPGEPVGPRVDASPLSLPRLDTLERALSLAGPRRSAIYEGIIPRRKGMSNSWAVSGTMTASGFPMLANDPHLGLDSPTLFYETHLVVEPATEADGPELNAFGQQFPGLPGLLLGHNDRVAWALTTASYDYTDAFRETLVRRDGEEYPRVLHNGEEVELELVEEVIEIGGGFGGEVERRTVKIPIVPHRKGPLVVEIRDGQVIIPEGDEAISLGWRGFEPSDEIAAILGVMTSDDVSQADTALDNWVIGSQNWLFADVDGNIMQTGKSFIPKRPAAAKTFHATDNPEGAAPWMVLSGSGEHDWQGQLPLAAVPNELNPERGYIVTANNDQTGQTLDNDPFNAPHPYLGYDYDLGFRAGRIERMITNADDNRGPDEKITLEHMSTYQGDVRSDNAERITPHLLAAAAAALEELAAPGTHPDLTPVLEQHPQAAARVEALRDLLASWDFVAADGLSNDPTPQDVTRANATSLFNFWQVAALNLALRDELNAAPGFGPTSQQLSKGFILILERPEQAATLNPDTGQSALWDNLTTPEVTESRNAILVAALFEADRQLRDAFGTDDPDAWIWGRLHTRRFTSIVPSLAPGVPHPFTIPQPAEGFPEGGIPTGGDNYNVNVCNAGVTDFNFRCGAGATMRMIIELDPSGVRAFNAMPGGQVWDSRSPYFRDQLELWLKNERHLNRFHPDQVAEAVEEHLLVNP